MDKSNNGNKHTSNNWLEQLQQIEKEDLKYLEKDLTFYEKVSLTFLLYGNTEFVQYALQKLIVTANNPIGNSNLLYEYTLSDKSNTNEWRLHLIEALTIIKSNKVLRKLGFNIKELKELFLPHVPEVTLNIYPILKALYLMCEELSKYESEKIIDEIKKNYKSANDLCFNDAQYLEIFLLDWIVKSIICIGIEQLPKLSKSTISNHKSSKVDLSPLYQCLKLEKEDLKEMLCSTVKSLDLKGKSQLNRIENDCIINDKISKNFDRKDSFTIKSEEQYLIRRDWAGFILIINQEQFYKDTNPEVQDQLPDKDLPKRRGTDRDRKYLEKTFSSFGYNPYVKSNLTNIQILSEVREIVKRSEAYDSVIVCILSHGIQGAIYGSNSLPVEIDQIQKIFAADTLLNKPKLLIIQACQGEGLQTAKYIKKFEYDSLDDNKSAPAFSDILTVTSSVPGFASVRHIEKGTWFIQTLCKLIDELGDRKHLLDILTAVIREVSTKRGSENQCMVPYHLSSLTKSFYLPRRK